MEGKKTLSGRRGTFIGGGNFQGIPSSVHIALVDC